MFGKGGAEGTSHHWLCFFIPRMAECGHLASTRRNSATTGEREICVLCYMELKGIRRAPGKGNYKRKVKPAPPE